MEHEEELGKALEATLEAHETELKRTLESLGHLQEAIREGGEILTDDEALAVLADIGQVVERHESHLQAVTETLDEHKKVIGNVDDPDSTALQEAMVRARQQARQESHPPDPAQYDTEDN